MWPATGSFTVIDVKALAAGNNLDQFNNDTNATFHSGSSLGWSFDWMVVLNPGTQPPTTVSVTTVRQVHNEVVADAG